MSTVGIIVNPHAGKDIRRLASGASHTSDATKVGILRRAIAGAAEAGAERILVSADSQHLAARAADGLDGLDAPVELLESAATGSRLDSVTAAHDMWKADAAAVVVLGGDGTCRDVAIGWPDVAMIAVSTGTNNVFPLPIDGTGAGVAAGLVASGAVDVSAVTTRAERVVLAVNDPRSDASPVEECALVEAALVDTSFVGARAVSDPTAIRWVVAAIAEPTATGLASIAGRTNPVNRSTPGGVLIRLGPGGRRVRVPLTPGTFVTVDVADVRPLARSTPIELPGGGVLALDGERTLPVTAGATVVASIEPTGPRVIDVERTLALAATERCFDVRGFDRGA